MLIQLTPLLILYIVAGIITLILAGQTWQMRPARGATYWSVAMFFVSIYVFASGLEVLFIDPFMKYRSISLIYVGIAGFIIFWVLFCVDYTQHEAWITPLSVSLLSSIPLITILLASVLEQHPLIYRQFELVEKNGLILFNVLDYGGFFSVWAGFSYTMFFIGIVLLIRFAWRYPHLFQEQTFLIIISALIPVLLSIPYLLGYNPIDPLDPSPFSLSLSGIAMYLGLSRYGFLKIIPVAHDLVFNQVASAVIIVDLQGNIVNMNTSAERIFHKSRDALVGQSIETVLPPYNKPEKQSHRIPDGNLLIHINNIPYEFKMTPLLNRRNKPAGRVIMLYDISQRMRIEEQEIQLAVEKEQVQFLKQFISDASHDLKTPLSTMRTTHYLLRRELGEQVTKRVDVLDSQLNRLIALVDNILFLVHLEERDTATLQETRLNDLIAGVISNYPLPSGHLINFTPAPNMPLLYTSPVELSQAVSHLLENALAHTPPDGDIIVRTVHEGDRVRISVQDTGTGIPEEDLPHIFDRFYRVDKARGTNSGTSGLGLAIVKRIMQRHGGSVDVSSTLGEGSTFNLWIPLAK